MTRLGWVGVLVVFGSGRSASENKLLMDAELSHVKA